MLNLWQKIRRRVRPVAPVGRPELPLPSSAPLLEDSSPFSCLAELAACAASSAASVTSCCVASRYVSCMQQPGIETLVITKIICDAKQNMHPAHSILCPHSTLTIRVATQF